MKIAINAILFIVMMLGVAVWSGFYFYLGNRSAPAFEPLIEEEGALRRQLEPLPEGVRIAISKPEMSLHVTCWDIPDDKKADLSEYLEDRIRKGAPWRFPVKVMFSYRTGQ